LGVAFALFALALVLGGRQMVVRSPLHASVDNPEHYYRSVTAHGSAMGYVFPTLVAMGLGYAITVNSLQQALIGVRWAWIAFYLVIVGTTWRWYRWPW
jgi:cytochrome c oxidase subunit 1